MKKQSECLYKKVKKEDETLALITIEYYMMNNKN